MTESMIEEYFPKRTRNSLSKIASPRKNLEFEQLHIYYQSKGLSLNVSTRTIERAVANLKN